MTRRHSWWGGREAQEEGINIYLRLIHIVVQEKTIQHCKAIKNKRKRRHSQKNITCSISPSKKSNWGSRKGIDYQKQPNKDINSKWLLLGTKATKVLSTVEDVLGLHIKFLCNSQHYNQLWIERIVMYFNAVAKQAWTRWFYTFVENANCSVSPMGKSFNLQCMCMKPGFPHMAMGIGNWLMGMKDILWFNYARMGLQVPVVLF